MFIKFFFFLFCYACFDLSVVVFAVIWDSNAQVFILVSLFEIGTIHENIVSLFFTDKHHSYSPSVQSQWFFSCFLFLLQSITHLFIPHFLLLSVRCMYKLSYLCYVLFFFLFFVYVCVWGGGGELRIITKLAP